MGHAGRYRLALALLLLGPLWWAGIATRSVWKPDEPREYALSVNMLVQPQRAVPLLADSPFAEKPPLTYWAAAAAMHVFGPSPAVARIPNLLYGLVTVLCTAWLAAALVPRGDASKVAASVALVVSGTAWLNFLHTIWLATDAPLLAASAVATLGAWLGATATKRSDRWRGYALFHCGLTAAFMAKNVLGLIAPVMALGLFAVWDGRWRELLRAPLWLGLAIPAIVIGSWIHAVAAQPDGARLLHVFLWDNSVGRFLPVESSGDYRNGHLNSPGKLVTEVAAGLLPWLFAALASLWFTLRAAFGPDRALASAMRFLLCASLPLIALLSFSSTVRDVYALPSMVALTAMIGVWWAHQGAGTAGGVAVPLTRALLWLSGLLAWALALAVPWLADRWSLGGAAGGTCAAIMFVCLCWSAVRLAKDLPIFQGLVVFCSGIFAAFWLASPIIERAQDLRPTAMRAASIAQGRPLLLGAGDETMAAALDYATDAVGLMTADLEQAWRTRPRALALVETGSDPLDETMRARLESAWPWASRRIRATQEPLARSLRDAGWTIIVDLPIPGGRHYQLFTPPQAQSIPPAP